MSESAAELLDILKLEALDRDLFRGRNESRTGARLFGGQVLAQSLAAAQLTTPDTVSAHSLHAYFLRPGDTQRPVVYDVERIRDGRSFVTRRIRAIQSGAAIFSMDVSFHKAEDGLAHQIDLTDMPLPHELEDDQVVARRMEDRNQISQWSTRERPFHTRSVYPLDATERPDTTRNPIWLRFRVAPQGGHAVDQQLLAYASDMGLVSTSYLPHREAHSRGEVQMASLDHAMWFHHEFKVTDWLLYVKETTSSAGSRGYNRGAFYTEDGKLVASTMQEGLMRVRA